MRVREALEQLDAIHDHLAKAEVYRGFTVPGVALIGGVGLAAAALQPTFIEPESFVAYWLAVATVGLLLGFGATIHAYVFREDEFGRRKTRRVVAQFLPSLAAGALVTAALTRSGADFVAYLPGLWANAFGLGIISAPPNLPRGIGNDGLA